MPDPKNVHLLLYVSKHIRLTCEFDEQISALRNDINDMTEEMERMETYLSPNSGCAGAGIIKTMG